MHLRILSWNVHGLPWPVTRHRPLRMRRIGERIAAERVDIALVQEVWAGAVRPLREAARGYRALFVPTVLGSATGGLVALVREGSGFAVDPLRFRRFARHAPKRRLREGDALAGKGALFLTLTHAASARRILVVNTHLQARYRPNDYAWIRLAQARELGEWLAGEEGPVLVAGDFNTPARESLIYDNIASLGVDLTAEERNRSGAVTNYPVHSDAAWIDYVLLRPGAAAWSASPLRLIENERIDHPYSDHSALVVDVELDFDTEDRSARVFAGMVP